MALGTTNISTDVVKVALEESSDDVGTLCKSSNINKWSKYKPFRSVTLFHTMAELLTDLQSKNYGLTIPSLTSSWLTAVNNSSAYAYNKPTGGSSSPYRLGDFRYYNHTAIAPAKSLSMGDIQLPFSGYKYATVMLSVSGGDYGIGLSDISYLSDCYLGVVLSSDNWSTVYLATSQTTIGDGATQVALGYHSPLITDTQKTFQLRMVAVYTSDTSAPVPEGYMYEIDSSLSSLRYLTLPFDAISSNLVTFDVYPSVTLHINVFGVIEWTSSTDWSIPFKIFLSAARAEDLVIYINGIDIYDSGTSSWGETKNLITEVPYVIKAGDTTLEGGMTPDPITYSKLAAPKPTLAIGDKVRVHGYVTVTGVTVSMQEGEVPEPF